MLNNHSFFCSWSGGKDSCLALNRAIEGGGRPACLLTMLAEDGMRSRSHDLSVALIIDQARSLGIPLVTCPASWEEYESKFITVLQGFAARGIEMGVFGDIDFEPHLDWTQKTCEAAGLKAVSPLFGSSRETLLDEFFNRNFKSTIIAVKDKVLGTEYLGRELVPEMLPEFTRIGIDIAGENGEYHTVVTSGPIFSERIHLSSGSQVLRDGCWFLELD